ncbi:hypothetical protein ECG_07684 [Echinococcus granulosus]|uniref:Uncharacterized protein n=1 Tax=Echinococcus granulosus TaxID=6210 RepID=A0A068WXQ8_ECHGR|nr:hypothetical protein ECG_07684 [Echinococcus granulosus]CDS22444.1 hypothetical protein EgrG_002031300 [Echinococcus granulosus]
MEDDAQSEMEAGLRPNPSSSALLLPHQIVGLNGVDEGQQCMPSASTSPQTYVNVLIPHTDPSRAVKILLQVPRGNPITLVCMTDSRLSALEVFENVVDVVGGDAQICRRVTGLLQRGKNACEGVNTTFLACHLLPAIVGDDGGGDGDVNRQNTTTRR